MKSLPVVLGMMLAVSLLFNVVAFVRLSEGPAAAAPARGLSAAASRPASAASDLAELPGVAVPRTVAHPLPAERESAPLPPPSDDPKPASGAAAIPTSSIRNDPKVREVLQANEAFNAFWKDLDRVAKVRSKFDDAKYSQTVLTATSDFLELGDPRRAQFEEAAQAAAAAYAAARREQDAAKKALPPKDKANPTTYAAYQQQKDAIDLRFDTQVQTAVASLKPYLTADNARHQEFLQSATKWLRNLAPRPTQP